MQYLLNTNTCIFFLREKLNLDEKNRKKVIVNCFISEITVLKLIFGAENIGHPLKLNKAVNFIVSGISVILIYGSIKSFANVLLYLNKMINQK
jgi:tRNA(fMet)-specific endonuclease VapC